ncbi:MAG: MFS transporter [Bacilli bacterium]|nr:MFS transporter [Bacilli bacterium]
MAKKAPGGIMASRIKSANVKFFPEAMLGYLGGPFFALIPNGIINVFLAQYWVNVLGIGEWANAFTWLLPLISSIFIIIGNLLVGKLMEGKPRKAGKARPLLVLSVPLLVVAIIALFMAPNPYNAAGAFNETVTIWTLIVVAIGYNLFYAFAWPMYYTSHSAMVNLSTRNATQRSLLGTLTMAGQVGAAGVAGMAGGLLADLLGLLPTKLNVASEIIANPEPKAADLVKKIWSTLDTTGWTAEQFTAKLSEATSEQLSDAASKVANSWFSDPSMSLLSARADASSRWFIIMIVLVVALVIGVALEFMFTRERITEEKFAAEEAGAASEKPAAPVKKVKMGDQIKVCLKDKYWWIIIGFFFLYQLGGMLKNNGQNWYSQAWTGGTSVSSLIGTLGAIPTALGMVVVWPLAHKFGKANTIKWGAALAVILGFIGWIPLFINATDVGVISTLSVVGFCAKAIGTVPAMYVSVALMSDMLDHQEAVYGIRTDGFTMSVYGSIMIAMTGISNAIILAINGMFEAGSFGHKVAMTSIFFGGEMVCYFIIFLILNFMNVEKFSDLDHAAIEAAAKKEAEAAGVEYVPAAVRLELEQKKAEEEAHEATIEEIRAKCEKSGANAEEAIAKFEADEKAKAEAAAAKKAEKDKANEEKRKAAEEKEAARVAALTPEQKKAEEEAKAAKEAKAEEEAKALAEAHAKMVEEGHKLFA